VKPGSSIPELSEAGLFTQGKEQNNNQGLI
jgi:hypothetical protein